MKTFLFVLSSLRNGPSDNEIVVGGTLYNHDQLLAIIEARGAHHAAAALNTKVVGKFVRRAAGLPRRLPTIYYTSNYYAGRRRPLNDDEGYFFLSLREQEDDDCRRFPNYAEKLRFRVRAPG